MLPAHWRGPFPYPAIVAVFICLALAVPAAASPTTGVHIVKLAADGVTVLNETTVDYRWMEAHLPVQGDGQTHYYHQGPVFTGDPWNPGEDTNVLEKDMGAVKGTDLADLCDLVGGMAGEDTVRIRAADGMSKIFPYRNVYEPEPRQGPMVITWYRADEGYVPDYYTGMRLVFFADTSTNPDGIHAFGIWDMHECFDPEYWYFFQPNLPTTTGLSVQYVSEIVIYSEEEPTGSIRVNSTSPGAAVYIDDEETGSVTPCTLSGIETGSHVVRVEKEGFVQPDEKWVTVVANTVTEVDFDLIAETGKIDVSSVPTNASIYLDGNDTGFRTNAILEAVPVGEHTIELVLSGYRNATQTVVVEMDVVSIVDVALSRESSDTGGSGGSSSGNGSISITSVPMNASIFLDGNATGFWTDATLEDIPVGEHTIELVMPGYRNVTRNVTVEEGRCSILDVILVLENSTVGEITGGTGRIAVSSVPANASIFLDGKDTGARTNTTLKAVTAGEHTVELGIPGYVNATRTVTIEEGKSITLDLILSRAGNETGANAAGRDGPGSGSPAPGNPIEALVATVLGFINGILSAFGIGGDLPATPEPESTVAPREDTATPEPTSTPVLTAPTPDGTPGTRSHSGGLYIQSYPPGMTIVVDNKKLVSQTPQVVYGLREGLHSIRVEATGDSDSDETGYRFETVQAWVYPDAISPVSLDGVTVTSRKTIRVESEAYQGERFTANGLYPAGTIPGDAVIEGMKSWVTVSRNGTFLSFTVPGGIGAGETYRIEPRSTETVTISIRSSPPGALVFIDGFPTGKHTPCRVEGLSTGQHRIQVSMPGYLPAEEVITIPEGSRTGGAITCTLEEYVHGDLLVESAVPDAKIYLYGRYTGEKTPYTFNGMSIGTYEVRAVSDDDSKTVEDVLVKPGETTRCVVALKEDAR